MLRKCLKCGLEFDGRPDSTLCPECAAASRKSTWALHPRTCRQCGATFMGGPRAWYCPSCRGERTRDRNRRYKKDGPKRHLGDIDICERCGKEYVVNGGLQRFCPFCSEAAIAENARVQSVKYNHQHIDMEKQRERRHAAAAQIPCAVCGKLFTPGVGSPLTCSPECAEAYHKQQSKDWVDAHREDLRQKGNARNRAKIAAMSPEELAAYRAQVNAKARENYKRRQAALTPEEKQARREHKNELARQRYQREKGASNNDKTDK